jgi:hypothetical protein
MPLKGFGAHVLKTRVRAQKPTAHRERLIGTIRRECLDYLIPLGERHLQTVLKEYVIHYNRRRLTRRKDLEFQNHPRPRFRTVSKGTSFRRAIASVRHGFSAGCINHLVEQDHRRVEQWIGPMFGFKRFDHASVTISGIELAEKIKKGRFKTGKFRNRKLTLWTALAA